MFKIIKAGEKKIVKPFPKLMVSKRMPDFYVYFIDEKSGYGFLGVNSVSISGDWDINTFMDTEDQIVLNCKPKG